MSFICFSQSAHCAGKTPLFLASCELEQLSTIIEALGTYNPHDWGGAHLLPDFEKIRFGESSGTPWRQLLPAAPDDALDLLTQLLRCDAVFLLMLLISVVCCSATVIMIWLSGNAQ